MRKAHSLGVPLILTVVDGETGEIDPFGDAILLEVLDLVAPLTAVERRWLGEFLNRAAALEGVAVKEKKTGVTRVYEGTK